MDLDELVDVEKRIVFQPDGGGVAIVAPCDPELTWRDVIAGAVPSGKPFKIVDKSDIPADRSQREAWTVDEADLTDGVGE